VTIRFLRCAILAVLAIGAGAFASPACAGEMKEVSCNTIALKYSGEARETKCLYYDDVGNQTEAVVQRIIVKFDTSELIVSHTAGRFRTYLPIQPLRGTVNGQYFSDTDNWQPETKYAGFDIAAFNGYESSGSQPVLCAAFARYKRQSGQLRIRCRGRLQEPGGRNLLRLLGPGRADQSHRQFLTGWSRTR